MQALYRAIVTSLPVHRERRKEKKGTQAADQ
jgi:hypothetical protein